MLKIVKVKNGYLRGMPAADPRIIAFRGIPYAEPPVGRLRWRRPQPCRDWKGVKECLEFSPISMQSIPGLDKENIYTREWNVDSEIPMSEDSLYVNVWTPAQSTADELPVYVWFHGGALQWGNSAEMEFDGERLARRGIIVVTVNYRLNVFGFFAHPDMEKENPDGDMNIGNLDQQFALQWVRENIRAFGGDPGKITIGGQSAGGGSVLTQLNSPENKNCIKGAIIESGIFGDPFKKEFQISKEEAVKQGIQFLDFLGVSTIDEARKLPAEYIRNKNDEFGKFWGTVIDGEYQKDSLYNHIRNRTFLDVPVLIGWTNNEFWTWSQSSSEEELLKEAEQRFGENGKEWLKLIDLEAGIQQAVDRSKVNAVEMGSRLFCALEEESGYSSSRYVYEFSTFIPGGDNPGAFHSVDLWFFFETLAKCWRPFTGKHYDLARQMCNYWANFIKYGNPNGADADGKDMEQWPPCKSQESVIMTFSERPAAEKRPADELQKLYIRHLKNVL